MTKALLLIKNDLFDIARLAKKIDEDNRIYYNLLAHRYELHKVGRGRQLVFCHPQLDRRALSQIEQSQAKYIQKIVEDMDKQNKALEAQKDSHLKDLVKYKVKNVISFIERGNEKLPSFDEI